MAYPTTAELVAASSGEAREALDALDAAQRDELRASAIAAVEAYCHQEFAAEGTAEAPVTKVIDGSGTDVLYLPKRLASLTSATLDGHLFAPADIGLVDGERIVLTSPLGGSWLTRVRRVPGDPGPAWNIGRSNVAVTGIWGWTDAEWAAGDLDAVATAIRFDMEDQALADAHALASTVRSSRALGVDSISQGSLSLTLRPGEAGISVRVQRRLTRFRWQGRLGAIA